jgi:hypothetical protein
MLRSVLVAFDGSSHAEAALAEAIDVEAPPAAARLTEARPTTGAPSWAQGSTHV